MDGNLIYQVPDETNEKNLEPGSYFGSEGETVHQLSSHENESIMYISTDRKFEVISE
ncbi:hypothetical protein DHD80_08380 [Gramella sp. AN32]|nr:hypothetical protein [Gramella sp. AN32]